jgi:hypothetical protein
MKKLFFIIITILIVSCNTNKEANSKENRTENKIPFDTLNSKIIISDSVYSKRLNIADMNTFLSFYQKNDTLFCVSTNAVMFYNVKSDKWMIYKLVKQKEEIPAKYLNQIGPDDVFQDEYSLSAYNKIITKHKNWFLISQAGEADECFKQEIVDTTARVLFRFGNESINDFYFDNKNLWICTDYKISKINTDSLNRTDYLILPVAKQLKAVIDLQDSGFYLDCYKGLYSYNKHSGQINPIIEINNYCYFGNYNFFNAILINDKIYVAGVEMYMTSNLILKEKTEKAKLFCYDLKTTKVEVYNTDIDFFDRFCLDGDNLLAYGVWQEFYEGGERNYYGGIISFNTINNIVKKIFSEPVISIDKKAVGFVARSYKDFDDYIITENYIFSKDYSVFKLEKDTFYSSPTLKDGDLHPFDKRYRINNTAYDKYSLLFKKLYNEEKLKSESNLYSNKYNIRQLKVLNGKVVKLVY